MTVMEHLEYEETPTIEVSEEITSSMGKYRILSLGKDLSIFITNLQAEKLFDELDCKLHDITYSDLQDENFNMDADLVTANELIEMMQESAGDTRAY